MALKPVVSQEEFSKLPEAIKGEYVEKGGEFKLNVEGVIPEEEHLALKMRLNEFRDRNVQLMKRVDQELEPKLKSYEGIDPEEFKVLKAEKEALRAKGVGQPADVEAAIARAVKPLQDRIQKQDEERAKLAEEATIREFDKRVTECYLAAGNNPVFIPDAIERAHKVFKYSDGKIVAKTANDELVYDSKGEPLSPEAWTPSLPKEFLLPSSGGGALPGGVGVHAQKSDGKIRNAAGTELKMDGITTL